MYYDNLKFLFDIYNGAIDGKCANTCYHYEKRKWGVPWFNKTRCYIVVKFLIIIIDGMLTQSNGFTLCYQIKL